MKKLICLLFCLFSLKAFTFSFIPENHEAIPVGSPLAQGLSKIQFDQVIDRVVSLYGATIAKKGATLIMIRNWEDPTVNAYASRDTGNGKSWYVAMYGGLARHPQINMDAFAVVVCHELGHHLGGAPKKRTAFAIDPMWASNEGESDYFASLKCLKKYFSGMDNQAALAQMSVPEVVVSACHNVYPNEDESNICQRSAMAALAVSKFLQVTSKIKKEPAFTTPDKKKVLFTSNKHPEAQCRLDTYFQAALCDQDADLELSNTDLNKGACSENSAGGQGIRPRCWMKKY